MSPPAVRIVAAREEIAVAPRAGKTQLPCVMSAGRSPRADLLLFRDPPDKPEPTLAQITGLLARMRRRRTAGRLFGMNPSGTAGKGLRGPRGAPVTDRPFAEAKEEEGGYLLVAAADFAAAARVARGCLILAAGTSLDVRSLARMRA